MMRLCSFVNALVLGAAVINGLWWLVALVGFNIICCGYIIWQDAGETDAN